jgi:transposase
MVACDLHDKTLVLMIARGREAAETLTLANTRSGRQKLIRRLQEQSQADQGVRVIFAYEASGQGFGLHDELTAAGIECHVLAPTKIARSPQQGRRKTDHQDAELLLQLLRGHVLAGNPLPSVWIPDTQTRDDREAVRARLDVAEKSTATKTQIQGLLKRHRLTRPADSGKAWTRGFMSWLRSLTRDETLGVGLRVTLASLLRQWEFLEEETERLDMALLQLASAPRYAEAIATLTRLQGVGVLTALVFLTELGDARRFANRRQIGAYLGLVPSSHESGACGDRKGHITRQGPSRVRRVLCQATWCRVREQGGADRAAYERVVRKNPKHKKIAVVASMRRLAVRMWHQAQHVSPGGTLSSACRRTGVPAPTG